MKKSSCVLLAISSLYFANAQTNALNSTGNAGIGTTSPGTLLTVHKPIVNNQVGTLVLFGYSGSADNRSFSFQQIGNASTAHQYFFLNGGLGTSTALGTPTLTSAFTPTFGFESNDNNLNILTASAGTNATAKRAMSFSGDGNVGIGTTSPSTLLHIGVAEGIGGSPYASSTLLRIYQPFNSTIQSASIDLGMCQPHARITGYGSFSHNGYGQLAFSTMNLGVVTEAMRIDAAGNIGIGTTSPQAKLAVNGDIFSKKMKVTQTGWPDYVFHSSYTLRPLSELERFIEQHKHLPDVPSAAEIEKDGLDLGQNQATLLKKIEELTLYIIQQNKQMQELQLKMQLLEKRLKP